MRGKIVLLLMLVFLAGCHAPGKATTKAMSTSELVKTHPQLQKICDLAGGCAHVKVECVVYDNSGNTNLRGETIWTVKTGSPDTEGEGFGSIDEHPLDAAVAMWMWDHNAAASMETPIYPNSRPCDIHCAP